MGSPSELLNQKIDEWLKWDQVSTPPFYVSASSFINFRLLMKAITNHFSIYAGSLQVRVQSSLPKKLTKSCLFRKCNVAQSHGFIDASCENKTFTDHTVYHQMKPWFARPFLSWYGFEGELNSSLLQLLRGPIFTVIIEIKDWWLSNAHSFIFLG